MNDHITHIARNHADHKGMSWCGVSLAFRFHFQDLDHAAENGRNGGRLVACKKCTKKAIQGLTNGQAEG